MGRIDCASVTGVARLDFGGSITSRLCIARILYILLGYTVYRPAGIQQLLSYRQCGKKKRKGSVTL